ncbi:hypothetical protein ABOONEI_1383 [Aciduliprofundum boonei T469]|nr:hypothetical protein ABOONEI_1383 [Aciduliprofundum boonei T469]
MFLQNLMENFKIDRTNAYLMASTSIEKKLDMILEKLEKIEELLSIEESEPYEDELEAIKEYLEEKKKGKLDLIPLEEALDEL